ncbi:MAG TPA: NAD(+)/NADH kinase [Tepidisphaeraceae bacterium]|nr:NAD(+)/NADH kinase [Tepidisphaeraceae bacterium]
MRLFIVANLDKPEVQPALRDLRAWLEKRVQIVGMDSDSEHDLQRIQADAILVLGGDGTLLSVARRLGGRQIPLIGINFGRLGFLASFTPVDFQKEFEAVLAGPGLPIERRLMLEVSVLNGKSSSGPRFLATALNDAVITAGPPFHMIELQIATESEAGVSYYGDGVIISTPSGSTAYNVSAGGPIVNTDVHCFVVTPLCPHSLSFRPVVVSAETTITITANRVNDGTTLFCDGQASTKLSAGDRVTIRRAKQDLLIVENPALRGWRNLARKLNWASRPLYNEWAEE